MPSTCSARSTCGAKRVMPTMPASTVGTPIEPEWTPTVTSTPTARPSSLITRLPESPGIAAVCAKTWSGSGMPSATPVRAGSTVPMRDAVAVVVQHDGVGGLVAVDAGRPAEVTHLRVDRDTRVELDQREVLRVLEDRVGEPPDRARRRRRAPPGPSRIPRLLADVAADRRLAEDAVARRADVQAAVAARERGVERALARVARDDRARPHARARGHADRRRGGHLDQLRLLVRRASSSTSA